MLNSLQKGSCHKGMKGSQNRRPGPIFLKVMSHAGWFSGRIVADLVNDVERKLIVSDNWEIFPAARSALLEFGGIQVIQNGPGANAAREPFEINPLLAMGESDRFVPFELVLGKKLYPMGEAATGHYFLAIAEDGQTFLLMHNLVLVGDSFVDALENLITGVRPGIIYNLPGGRDRM